MNTHWLMILSSLMGVEWDTKSLNALELFELFQSSVKFRPAFILSLRWYLKDDDAIDACID